MARNRKIALIYPPTADPTAPYLSVPILTGYLRSKGMDVLPIDANLEWYDFLLKPENLRKLSEKVDRRLARLKKEPARMFSGGFQRKDCRESRKHL